MVLVQARFFLYHWLALVPAVGAAAGAGLDALHSWFDRRADATPARAVAIVVGVWLCLVFARDWILIQHSYRTLDYLRDRKQFGVPIGSFQALQHRAASLFGEIEMCKSIVLKALQTLDEKPEGDPELASLTKARVSATAHQATAEAIQMHGGIGMTDDFDIGFFLKRYRILETLYGDRYFHLDRYAKARGY